MKGAKIERQVRRTERKTMKTCPQCGCPQAEGSPAHDNECSEVSIPIEEFIGSLKPCPSCGSEEFDRVIVAAKNMDWAQVVGNYRYGPPCFHLCEDGYFCGRAKGWPGHDDKNGHIYLSLDALLETVIARENEACAILGGYTAEFYEGHKREFPDGQAVADAIRRRRA